MRQLLLALVLLTVVFVVVGTLVLLLIAIDYAADSAISWVELEVRPIHFSMHRFPRIASLTVKRRERGLDPDSLTPERLEA